ncbi:MAG TPA: MmcQ/YjbR family DNA-binding protein [Planctomycetes bacterium]|nr:MmcQ/YjbR family DNA-binding protein [Planctomycetota bacterium]
MTSRPKNLLDRVRKIALSFPDTEESSRLGGSPHFYVRGKIFSGCGDEGGTWSVGVKVGLELQSLMVERPGIHIAKYCLMTTRPQSTPT